MKILRTASTRRLLLLLAAVTALAVGLGAIAVAASGTAGEAPPPASLAQALHDAAAAPAQAGIQGQATFTNNLFPSGAILGQTAAPLLSGGSGRFWITNDGRGRIELTSDAGLDSQIVWSPQQATIYDGTSNTAYRIALPAASGGQQQQQHTPPSVAQIEGFLSKLAQQATVSGAVPGIVAGRGAYTVSVSPQDQSGLIGGASLAWDAATGTPLSIGIYARGDANPVLGLTLSGVSYGPVASSDVDVSPPPGAKVVDVPAPAGKQGGAKQQPVTGLAAVQARLPFTLVAPDALGGLQRTDVRLVGTKAALLVYGQGLGAVAVLERQPGAQGGGSSAVPSLLDALPKVSLNGTPASELSTPLGTVLRFERGGIAFVVGGSLPAATVQGAATGLVS